MKVEVEFTFCYIVGIQFVTGNLQWCKNLNQIRTIKSGWICEVHEVTKCMTNTQCDAFTFLTHPPTRKYLYSLSCPAITGVCLVEHRILLWCPCSRRCSQEVSQHFSKEEVHTRSAQDATSVWPRVGLLDVHPCFQFIVIPLESWGSYLNEKTMEK